MIVRRPDAVNTGVIPEINDNCVWDFAFGTKPTSTFVAVTESDFDD